VALFKKKSPEGDGEVAADAPFEPQPEKAQKWFDHAKTAAMSSNYDYALRCYANGIRLDPGRMSAHLAMMEAAVGYLNSGAKPASGKEIRGVDDGTPIGKFAAAEFEWMKDLKNHKAAIKALEMAVKADQGEFGNWIAQRVFLLLRAQKKHTKNVLLQTMELFRAVNAWDESMAAGEMARELDPADSDLDAELKNLSAQRAMDQGGYVEAAGTEGGFRKFIRDADTQQELIEQETLAASASTEERNLERARIAYEENTAVPDNLNRYAQLLKKKGTEEAEQKALEIYEKGFEETGEYRFRMSAGDIRIERLARAVVQLNEKIEASPSDDGLLARREQASKELLALKSAEYRDRCEKYPTDRPRKFQLGEVQFDLGEYEEAMAQFQASKDDPKLRVRSGHMLGRCFLAEEWYTEAISEMEEALHQIDATEKDRELMIRYDLMVAMIAGAREEDSIDLARQAKSICSDIARKDITYRDIRAKRREVDDLIKGLTGAA
jgi:hypothetical protein